MKTLTSRGIWTDISDGTSGLNSTDETLRTDRNRAILRVMALRSIESQSSCNPPESTERRSRVLRAVRPGSSEDLPALRRSCIGYWLKQIATRANTNGLRHVEPEALESNDDCRGEKPSRASVTWILASPPVPTWIVLRWCELTGRTGAGRGCAGTGSVLLVTLLTIIVSWMHCCVCLFANTRALNLMCNCAGKMKDFQARILRR